MDTERTEVTLCSASLDRLGLNAIEALDGTDTTPRAATCSRQWPLIRDKILSSFDWGCTKDKKQLSKSGTVTPLNEWKNAFLLPQEMVGSPIAVYGDGSSKPTFSHEIFGNYLYADYETVIVDFKIVPDVKNMPGYLYDLLVTCLAHRMCMALTGDKELMSELRLEAYGHPNLDGNGGAFLDAKRTEARNRPIKSLVQNGDPLTAARN